MWFDMPYSVIWILTSNRSRIAMVCNRGTCTVISMEISLIFILLPHLSIKKKKKENRKQKKTEWGTKKSAVLEYWWIFIPEDLPKHTSIITINKSYWDSCFPYPGLVLTEGTVSDGAYKVPYPHSLHMPCTGSLHRSLVEAKC